MSRALVVASALVISIATQLTLSPAADGRVDGAAPRFKAVAFDYFVLFDPDSVVPQAEALFPGKGRELTTVWRTRQFEYTWLRSVAHRYADFSAVTRDALTYAAHAMNLELTPGDERRLLDAYLHLTPWPDTVGALQTLRRSGIRVIALSNFSPAMLRANADRAHILDLVDAFVSTDENRTYKPDPRAYQLGVDRLHLPKSAIVFAASGGWDAAGAKSFGYPTFWVNRANQPTEQLGVVADATSPGLAGLLEFLRPRATEVSARCRVVRNIFVAAEITALEVTHSIGRPHRWIPTMGGSALAIDCGLRLHRPRLCEGDERTRPVRSVPSCIGSSRVTLDGLGHDPL
jgi:2-haloacid dehalogenase